MIEINPDNEPEEGAEMYELEQQDGGQLISVSLNTLPQLRNSRKVQTLLGKLLLHSQRTLT